MRTIGAPRISDMYQIEDKQLITILDSIKESYKREEAICSVGFSVDRSPADPLISIILDILGTSDKSNYRHRKTNELLIGQDFFFETFLENFLYLGSWGTSEACLIELKKLIASCKLDPEPRWDTATISTADKQIEKNNQIRWAILDKKL